MQTAFRLKVVCAAFLSSAIIFIGAFYSVTFIVSAYYTNQADITTSILLSAGELSEENSEGYGLQYDDETPYKTRYFTVKDGIADLSHVSLTEQEAALLYEAAVTSGDSTGYVYSVYRFRLSGSDAAFLDCSTILAYQTTFKNVLGTMCLLFPILITLVFFFISKIIFKPFEENAELQKQFITDAGHELKTPLTVISANAAVLEYTTGGNEWLSNITGQTTKMGELIDSLLFLVKSGEYQGVFKTVNISAIVNDRLKEFNVIFGQKNIALSSDVCDEANVSGDETQLSMLVSALIENAAKYTAENGRVAVTVTASGKKVVFKVFNTPITGKVNVKKIFTRFYRSDASRNSSTGGHGIGLAAAKRITEQHGGTITAKEDGDGLMFTVTLKAAQAK